MINFYETITFWYGLRHIHRYSQYDRYGSIYRFGLSVINHSRFCSHHFLMGNWGFVISLRSLCLCRAWCFIPAFRWRISLSLRCISSKYWISLRLDEFHDRIHCASCHECHCSRKLCGRFHWDRTSHDHRTHHASHFDCHPYHES